MPEYIAIPLVSGFIIYLGVGMFVGLRYGDDTTLNDVCDGIVWPLILIKGILRAIVRNWKN